MTINHICRAALALAFGLCLSLPAVAQTSQPASQEEIDPNLPTEETVRSFMHRMFGYEAGLQWRLLAIRKSGIPGVAEILVQVGGEQGRTRIFVMPGGEHAVIGDPIPFGADPFGKTREILAKRATGPTRGAADATVSIVEFSDLQCPNCKIAEPVLDRLLAEMPNVRIVFQHFPLTSIHKWAFKAATYAECVQRESTPAFWQFTKTVYEKQPEINESNADEKLTAYASESGLDGAAIAACAETPGVTAKVNASLDLGRSVGVNSTPTVFINGRKVPGVGGVPFDTLKALVAFEASQVEEPAAQQ